jgi:hypothetical protein
MPPAWPWAAGSRARAMATAMGGNASFVPRGSVLSAWERSDGEVPERSIGAVSKTVVPLAGTQGSNPCLSAVFQ